MSKKSQTDLRNVELGSSVRWIQHGNSSIELAWQPRLASDAQTEQRDSARFTDSAIARAPLRQWALQGLLDGAGSGLHSCEAGRFSLLEKLNAAKAMLASIEEARAEAAAMLLGVGA